jgi:hypothetical protein
MKTKKDRILDLLKRRKTVSQRELNDIAYRYGARLFDLRADGYRIATKIGKKGQFFYSLIN